MVDHNPRPEVSHTSAPGGELLPLPTRRLAGALRQPRALSPDPERSWLVDVNPVAKLFVLALLSAAFFAAGEPRVLLALAAGLLALALGSVYPRVYFVMLLVPVTVLGLVVSLVKWKVAGQPFREAFCYGLAVHLNGSAALITVLSTRLLDLMYALDVVLRPLRWIGLNTRPLVIGAMLAVRLFFEALVLAVGVVKANRSRGLPIRGLDGVRRLVLPTIARLNHSSGQLADALALRGIDLSSRFSLLAFPHSRPKTLLYVTIGVVAGVLAVWLGREGTYGR